MPPAPRNTPSPLMLLAASFAFIIVPLDVTIVNVALPRIGVELGAGVGALQWVVDAYTLGFAVLLLAAGVMGDKFGPRRVFLGGFGPFAAGRAAEGGRIGRVYRLR
jgi:DHA2 family methylenomycin A resistance protein-like MFS transporter